MTDTGQRTQGEADEGPPPETSRSADASAALLLGALGRALRYGGELALLEVRAARRSSALIARFMVLAWLCVLTAWLALNAGLVMLLRDYFGFATGWVLLGAALVNVLLAGLFLWLASSRWNELRRSPLRVFLK
ncbi:MAG: hypothetical protein JJU27_07610 [Gammaproteobacteria bacterium]|nr:hypothetical protein [Gammaproteobacteria bacterium]